MKKLSLLIIFFILPLVLAKPVINDYVIDEANLLSSGTEQELRSLLQTLEQETTTQFAIVTIQSLEGEPIEDYSLSLAHEQLGQADKDNGLLLLISLDDRSYRIEVGQGLEGVLNDAKAGRIGRDYLVPAFQAGSYEEGIVATAEQLILAVKGEYTEPATAVTRENIKLWSFIILMVIFVLINIFKNTRRGKNGGLIWIGTPGFGRGSGGFGGFGGGGGFSGGGGGGKW